MKDDSPLACIIFVLSRIAQFNALGFFHWSYNTRAWSTDRLGTDLIEGAD